MEQLELSHIAGESLKLYDHFENTGILWYI